ncbi:MAG: hypothetical protein RIQ53_1346 [Pseudomonadota bacterium]
MRPGRPPGAILIWNPMSLLKSLRATSRAGEATAARRRRPLAVALAATAVVVGAAVLAACGGSVSQATDFEPGRLIVLGDEHSVLDDSTSAGNARKYGVNGLDSSGNRDCTVLPSVIQYVASRYGLVFAACNPSNVTVTAWNRARAGAKVEGGGNSLAEQIASGALRSDDLVTVWIGTHDVIEVYRQFNKGQLSEAGALAEIERRGAAAAAQINGVLATGARALVFTVPDLGLSPYARAMVSAADPDDATIGADSAAMSRLTALSKGFNAYLRTAIDSTRYDGRNFGLIFPDEVVQALTSKPTSYLTYLVSPYNVSSAVCAAAQPACDNETADLVSSGVYNGYLWASPLWFSYPAHHLLAVQVNTRLSALPF